MDPDLVQNGASVVREWCSWLRIWWVASGILNVLPIYAALTMSHRCSQLKHIIHRVQQPLHKSLAYADKRAARIDKIGQHKAILIGVPETLGHTKLRFLKQEIDPLKKHTTIMENPTH